MAEEKAKSAMDIYKQLSEPPDTALKKIKGGKLNGFTDINPQWRIKAMTEVFGLCGKGWKYEPADIQIIPGANGEQIVEMKVAVYFMDKETGKWSAPVYGWGGDRLIKRERSGLVSNEEAFKMAFTDGFGKAVANLGMAANVYMGQSDDKYARQSAEYEEEQTHPARKYSKPQQSNRQYSNQPQQKSLARQAQEAIGNISLDDFARVVYHLQRKEDLSDGNLQWIINNKGTAVVQYMNRAAKRNEAQG